MGTRLFLGGGIGGGKSAAAAQFASLGAVIVSGDDAGRAVLQPGTPETVAVAGRWPGIVDAAGVVDRPALGRIVFADPGQLGELEAITLPGIRHIILTTVEAHPDDVVLVEVPVLRDLTGRGWGWIVVDAPDDLRMERVVARSGIPADEVRQVMARQPSRGEWLEAAAWVIDNAGTPAQLVQQCRRVWERIS